MSFGLHSEGFSVLAGVDTWKPALNTFALNHPGAAPIQADLTEFHPDDLTRHVPLLGRNGLDCIIGGPPCQGFSKNVPAAYRFLEDPRNQLFREYLRFVDAFRPRFVVMENVAEIYNAYAGQVRDEVVEKLEDFGYKVAVRVLQSEDYGIPQRRRRCFFIASNTGIRPSFPSPTHRVKEAMPLFGKAPKHTSAWAAISDLPVLQNGDGYEPMDYSMPPLNDYQRLMRKDSTQLWDHITRRLRQTQFERINCIAAGEGIKDLPAHLRPKSGYSGAYGRLDYEMVAPTITRWVFHPGSGRFSHPREARLLTIREAARLQSFSDLFRFTGSYTQKAGQVGNAVPPMLMRSLASEIKRCCAIGEECDRSAAQSSRASTQAQR